MHTVITAQVEDQSLLITNLPKLASGGFNEVKVEFTFCPLWDGLIKIAMFYTDKSRVYYTEIKDGEAVVPHEVLANEGILHFGVFGYNTDPIQTRTTEVLHLTIVEGAITDSTAIHIDPTPDVYQQLLLKVVETERLAAECERLASGIVADVEAGMYNPKRGVDYWTEADRQDIERNILAHFTDVSEVAL